MRPYITSSLFNTMSDKQIRVTATFSFNGQDGCGRILIAEPEQFKVYEVCPEAQESNTHYNYSGRHDFGTLPPLKSDGPNAQVLYSLQQAKTECDKYLTSCIEEHISVDQKTKELPPKNKKMRLNQEVPGET